MDYFSLATLGVALLAIIISVATYITRNRPFLVVHVNGLDTQHIFFSVENPSSNVARKVHLTATSILSGVEVCQLNLGDFPAGLRIDREEPIPNPIPDLPDVAVNIRLRGAKVTGWNQFTTVVDLPYDEPGLVFDIKVERSDFPSWIRLGKVHIRQFFFNGHTRNSTSNTLLG